MLYVVLGELKGVLSCGGLVSPWLENEVIGQTYLTYLGAFDYLGAVFVTPTRYDFRKNTSGAT